ncbi:MAG TPA: hypothetical protein VGR35_16780 [Tepidisphaeraceae bacterium]|nr:hypothetical protein [Tepidisphaeraceae bacterium]
MLTPSESKLLPSMLQRSLAGDCLHLMKMREMVPIDVDNPILGYKCRIVEMVFDPARLAEVNGRFAAEGYIIPDKMNVIAVNDDGTILVWGGANCVFWLRKGQPIAKGWDDNLAFEDLGDLTHRFKIRNKKAELDDMIKQLNRVFGTN